MQVREAAKAGFAQLNRGSDLREGTRRIRYHFLESKIS
jgi:hypothetical protein